MSAVATPIDSNILNYASEQRFVRSGLSWDEFKAIQRGFDHSAGIRLFYYHGELEILSTSSEHEIVKGNIGFLVEDYMLTAGLEFVATGSFSQERDGEVAAQADESYCFDQAKPIPDLAIEVVITSGGPSKLKRYQALGVREVWFWEDGTLEVHVLENDRYQRLTKSQFLPDLNLETLARCASIFSRSESVRQFRSGC
jgi:Uma2 family endonuclease